MEYLVQPNISFNLLNVIMEPSSNNTNIIENLQIMQTNEAQPSRGTKRREIKE